MQIFCPINCASEKEKGTLEEGWRVFPGSWERASPGKILLLLIEFLQKVVHLSVPPGPVVIDIMAPKIDPGRDTFGAKDCLQKARILYRLVFPGPLPYTGHDIAFAVPVEKPLIGQAWQIIEW